MARVKAIPSWMSYQAHRNELDIEIFPFEELRHRGRRSEMDVPHRYDFYMLICVSEGEVRQIIDFEPIHCATRSVLVLRPGQVHNFVSDVGWEGWLVLFRAEFMPAWSNTTSEIIPTVGLDQLPNHLRLREADFVAVTDAIERMRLDAAGEAPAEGVHALLRHQLNALLLRLMLLFQQEQNVTVSRKRNIQRFIGFRSLVERKFADWHQVAPYADALGCTEKSLTYSTKAVVDLSAKDYISRRLILEAKRLLAHSEIPVYAISEMLGFAEATNFSKFFKREAGYSPLQFRQQH